MSERTMLEDVRDAKRWMDAQSATLPQHFERVREMGRQFEARTGAFADVPRKRPAWVQEIIDAAADDPGHEAIDEMRRAFGRA